MNSGDGLLVGSIFGIAAGNAANAETVETALVGIFDLEKVVSQAWSAGDKIYWDNSKKEFTKTATATTLIGVAAEAVAGGEFRAPGDQRHWRISDFARDGRHSGHHRGRRNPWWSGYAAHR
ncbi:DUF2190 family protein [Pikeienuella piscinae]|uniref:DUF2190 family protein n=1 Tax=Pikeienuella piscinae TaxID=2748098 RepID=UPI001FEBFD3E|nr:DUF2190 family protein [Pikeienuella piscinae]